MGRNPKLGRLKIRLGGLFFFGRHLQKVKFAGSNDKVSQTKPAEICGFLKLKLYFFYFLAFTSHSANCFEKYSG